MSGFASKNCDNNNSLNVVTLCLFCDQEFKLPSEEADILQHMFLAHHFIIGDSHLVANLQKYLNFWRIRFKNELNALENFCTIFKLDIEHETKVEKDAECFMLSDNIEEDKYLRQRLHEEKLDSVLAQQKLEREERNFNRCCLFCRYEEKETRANYLHHLAENHNLQLGRPDNLVFVDKFLDCIEEKIKNLECIYCERTFKDRTVLREHMRKKSHKRPNPDNLFYNQFYLVNYREIGKTWQDEVQNSSRHHYSSESEEEDGDWSDWQENEKPSITCLFCSRTGHSWNGILLHMSAYHKFNYQEVSENLNFYQQVKVVNYVRQQIADLKCITCHQDCESISKLLTHMETSNHLILPDHTLWDHLNFLHPTLENDNFLTHLDDNDVKENAE